MTTQVVESHHAHHDSNVTDVFGFWLYILTDCILFATLFAAYAVLKNATFGGTSLKHLISLHYVLTETMFLLTSSFTYGLAMLGLYKKKRTLVTAWLTVTFLCGVGFIIMEVHEFIHLYAEGHSWHVSAAMSAFFALVGTHGLHVSVGLIWMAVMIVKLSRVDLDTAVGRKLTYLGLFWHFLDIVWIFVFTIVYLMGAL